MTAAPSSALGRLRAMPYRNELIAMLALLVGVQLLRPHAPLGIQGYGAVAGMAFLLHAIGIILVHRTGRFINFAQVQIGLTGASLFTSLVHGRTLIRNLDGICGCIGEDPPLWMLRANYVAAIGLGLLLSVLLAAISYIVVVRRFEDQPRLVLTIATLFGAQLLAWLSSEISNRFTTDEMRDQYGGVAGSLSAAPGEHLGLRGWWTDGFRIGPAQFQVDAVILVVLGIAACVGVAWYLRSSSTGMSIRAAAENTARARTLGVNVEGVNLRVWLIVGLLSGCAGIVSAFAASRTAAGSLSSAIPVNMLVFVLAAAVIARFTSLAMAALAAVTLGVVQQGALWAFGSSTPVNASMVFIIGGLLLLQRRSRGRSDAEDVAQWQGARENRPIPRELRGLPVVRKWVRIAGVATVVLVLAIPWVLSPSKTSLTTSYGIYMIVGLALLVLTGWAGQISIGQFGFAAIGGWTVARWGIPFGLDLVAAGVVGAVAAVIVGVPALKLRGLNLAISTLAFAVSATALFLGDGWFGKGLPEAVGRPTIVGMSLNDERTFFYFVLLVLGTAYMAVVGLRRTRTGRVLIAVRENEAAAEAYGINILRARLTAFAFAGFLSAVAGGLFAYNLNTVTVEAFAPELSLLVFTFTVIGGLGGIGGPILGFVYYGVLSTISSDPAIRELGAGLPGLVLLMSAPGGVAQVVQDIRDAMLRRVAARYRIVVPSLIADQKARADQRARLVENVMPGGRPVFVPRLYEPPGQWALERYGMADAATKERVGG